MTRKYISVRLAYETKYFSEVIAKLVESDINELISDEENKEIENLIRSYLKSKSTALENTAITIVLKTGISTIIEQAYYDSINYSIDDWLDVENSLIHYLSKEKIPPDIEVGSLSARLFLENDVIKGLEKYQSDFKKPDMIRNVKLSYVIKIILFSYFTKLKKVS